MARVFSEAQENYLKELLKVSFAPVAEEMEMQLKALRDLILTREAKDIHASFDTSRAATAVPEAASGGGQTTTASRTRKRRERRNKQKNHNAYARGVLLSARVTDNVVSTTWEKRLANVEQVVATVCIGTEQVVATSQSLSHIDNDTRPDSQFFDPWPGVDWGPWQGAIPAEELHRQCSAACLVQVWWRRSRSRHAVHRAERKRGMTAYTAEPLAFLSVQDIGRLQAVSWAHCKTLFELGFEPPVDEDRPEEEEEDESESEEDEFD